MSCYHPLVLIKTSDMTDPKQRKIVENLKFRHLHDEKIKSVNTIIIPREIAIDEGIRLEECHAIPIPCGSCIGCRLDYSRTWAERCIHEAEMHEENYFLTLTYDDEHLPKGPKGMATLVDDELSDFIKRLRSTFKRKFGLENIRFFGCGEYGDHSLRPHYHIILFNCPIPDLQERHPIMVDGKLKNIRQYDSNNELLMYSPTIGKCWNKGTAQIGKCTYESCAYVARYIVKKYKGLESKYYADAGVIPEYVRMSRRPGIGYDWYNEHFEQIYKFDNISFKRGDVVVNMKPGRYFDKLLKDRCPEAFYDRKLDRANDFYDGVQCKTFECVDLATNNKRAESAKLNSIKALKRSLE